MSALIERYGARWPADTNDLQIEMSCIKKGGKWVGKGGNECGLGKFHHYRQMMTLCWPDDDHHRWSDLALERICGEEIVVFMGSADSNKTYAISRFVMCDWWTFSDNTLWMVSSTELRGAELRIWGKLKELFNRARELHPWLAGTVIESKHAITSEKISEDGSEGRLLTKGIIFIPCKSNNTWVGMGSYAGIKPTKNGRLGHVGDECSAMQPSFLHAYANWYGKENFKGLLSGNPIELDDTLCVASEPVEGWDNWHDTGKTQEWRSKFYHAWVVAYDGRDSPNFDYPESSKPKFPYLIGPKKLQAVAKTLGEDSHLWWMQCVGKPRPGAESLKVISRKICEKYGAFEDVIWAGTKTTQIVALDAAYGGIGGDRCTLVRLEFGTDINNKIVIRVHPVVIVPVSVRNAELPDRQIATFVKQYCEGYAVPPENFFFDGRSTLAVTIAQIWSVNVNVVDFGGTPTARPVSLDEFIWDGEVRSRRLKRCDEHYSKFVTELWFTVYYAIISGQIRNLPQEVASEGYKRLWRMKGNKIEVETKQEMKERTNQSPDLFDALVTGVEGARRRGFQISKLANGEDDSKTWDWLDELARKQKDLRRKSELTFS